MKSDNHDLREMLAGWPYDPENAVRLTRGADGRLRVSGGRVLGVTAVAPTIEEAAQQSRVAAEAIHFEGKQFRRDIGWRELARLR